MDDIPRPPIAVTIVEDEAGKHHSEERHDDSDGRKGGKSNKSSATRALSSFVCTGTVTVIIMSAVVLLFQWICLGELLPVLMSPPPLRTSVVLPARVRTQLCPPASINALITPSSLPLLASHQPRSSRLVAKLSSCNSSLRP